MSSNKELVEGVYASFAQGDVPTALAALADDIRWTEAEGGPLGGTYVGPQGVLEGVLMRLGEYGDDFAVNVDRLLVDGDTVVALGTYTWNRRSNGEPAEVAMAHVWTIADGKATRFHQHLDTARTQELR